MDLPLVDLAGVEFFILLENERSWFYDLIPRNHHNYQSVDPIYDWFIESVVSRLSPLIPKVYALPAGIDVIDGSRGPRFRGAAQEIYDSVQPFRYFRDLPEGTSFIVSNWTLRVCDQVESLDHTVSMPGWAWGFAAGILGDVAWGQYDNPFYFGSTGPLDPPLENDIGVEVVGEFLS